MDADRVALDAIARARGRIVETDYLGAVEALNVVDKAGISSAVRADVDQVLRESMIALASSQGHDPGEYARAFLDERYERAIETGSSDGLAGLTRMAALSEGISVFGSLAGDTYVRRLRAALGYQRANALRDLARIEEADDAYAAVADCFLHDSDEGVQFWSVLALAHQAQMLLSTPRALEHPARVRRALGLVDTLFAVFSDSEQPDVRILLGQAAALEVHTLLLVNRIEEASAAYQERSRALSDDGPDVRDELEGLAPVVGQVSQGPLSGELLKLCTLDDESWSALMSLATAPEPAVVCFQHLELFTDRAVERATEALAQARGDERDALEQALTALESVREANLPFRLGSGPLEQLFSGIGVRFSTETASNLARRVSVVRTLSPPYVVALCSALSASVANGNWRLAWQGSMVLRAAMQRLPTTDDTYAMSCDVGLTLLEAAQAAWTAVPDVRVLRIARETSDEVLAVAAERGQPIMQGKAHEAFGLVCSGPTIAAARAPELFFYAIRRWWERLPEEITTPLLDRDAPEWRVPGMEELLDEAEPHLRQAVELLPRKSSGTARLALLDVSHVRQLLGEDVDVDRLGRECMLALEVLGSPHDSLPDVAFRVLVHFSRLGGALTVAQLEGLLSLTPVQLRERYGLAVAARSLATAAELLVRLDPDRGVALMDQADELLDEADEEERLLLLRWHWILLAVPRVSMPKDVAGGSALADILPRIDVLSAESAWSEHERLRAVLAVIRSRVAAADGLEAQEADEVIGTYFEAAEALCAGRPAVLAFGISSFVGDLATRAMARGEWQAAIQFHILACAQFLWLKAYDAAREGLTLIEVACRQARDPVGRAFLESFYPVAVEFESVLDSRAAPILQRVYRRVLQLELPVPDAAQEPGQMVPADIEVILGCLQMAKGLRFAASLSPGEPYDWRVDDEDRRLLEVIRAGTADLERFEDDGPEDGEPSWSLDDITLLSAYDETLDHTPSPSAQHLLENLERTFDARVQRRSLGDTEGLAPIFHAELDALLPPDTELLLLYAGVDRAGAPAVTYLMASGGRPLTIGVQRLAQRDKVVAVSDGNRQRFLDELSAYVLHVRREIQEDPAARVVTPEAQKALEASLNFLLGPGVAHLQTRIAEGVRHLCVVPHGPLHYLPFHLLHLDGRPLAEHVAVTVLPNMAMLRSRPGRERSKPLTAIGVDFADVNPFRLPTLEDAADEARRVAEFFDVEPVLGSRATESAIRTALAESRFVHIATHGEHDVPAPAFQKLYTVPEKGDDGRLASYELLECDCQGLDLVTLSACETALGRFDRSDNLLGIPAALFSRGADALVGTLWEVETTVSRDFFLALYRNLRSGLPRGEAFHEATREVRRSHKQYRDWGAFQFLGNWR